MVEEEEEVVDSEFSLLIKRTMEPSRLLKDQLFFDVRSTDLQSYQLPGNDGSPEARFAERDGRRGKGKGRKGRRNIVELPSRRFLLRGQA